MSTYKHILLALDLTEDFSEALLNRALGLSKSEQCRLSILHVVKPIGYTYDRGLSMGMLDEKMNTLQAEAIAQAKDQLAKIGKEHSIPEDRLHCKLGKPAREILNLSNELKADLVIVGGHSNPGPLHKVGATVRGTIDKLNCDTLVVHHN